MGLLLPHAVCKRTVWGIFELIMNYRQFSPHPELSPYIDAYWRVTGDRTVFASERIMPDGCVDIIVNLGTDLPAADGGLASPKEFINFVRYQYALQYIGRHYATKSLMDIAVDSGYYDHAHLANEIKKYSGLVPSQL